MTDPHTNSNHPAQLPIALLERLRNNSEFLAKRGPTRDPDAMREAAQRFGIATNSGGTRKANSISWWNETINALDDHYPNWRGRSAPKANRAIAKVLANRSTKDAA